MSRLALVGARVLSPQGWRENVVVLVRDGRIEALATEVPEDAARVELGGGLLLPGFIDTQVNGGGGLLFNDAPSVETLARMARAHRRFGTTGLLPTLISDNLGVVAAAIRAADDAIAAGVPGILGVHIEGPFLNLSRRGIHAAQHIRSFERSALQLLSSATRARTLVTLAPECLPASEIAELVAAGVIVAGGHSEADYDTVAAAADAGLSGVTHLFNAMSPLNNRAPGMTGAALADDRITAGLIVDGHHVHPANVRIALKAKGPERIMLVTDAMSLAGTENQGFLLQGRPIRREGDRLVGEGGTLAGSTLTMADAVRNMVAQTGCALADAVRMASATPAGFLGLSDQTGSIAPGLAADLILVDEDLSVQRSWIRGCEAEPA